MEEAYMVHAHPELVGHEDPPGEESHTEWEDFMNAEDYLNDGEKFNVTNRLVLLFPKIEVKPADGYISESELTEWNVQQSEREVMHRIQREMETHDKIKMDLFHLQRMILPVGFVCQEEDFNVSDADGDGVLNITEFNHFLHPADSKNPKLLLWLCKEEVRERDLEMGN